jgi:putative transposase
VILALYARLVIGWAMAARLTVDRTQQARRMALHRRAPKAGLVHHSDQGSP